MHMAPDSEIYAHAREVDGRAAHWAELARAAAEPNSFYAPEWLIPALRHLDADGAVRLIEIEEDGVLIGILPVVTGKRHGRLPVRHVANWVHPYCFLGSPIVRAGAEQAAWRGFLETLDAARWADGFLHLTGFDAAGANAAALEAVCVAQARPMVSLGRYDRAFLRSPLSAEDYWDAHVRPKKRKEIRRLQKRLAELGTVEHRRLEDPAQLARWCDDFLALEASGWKGKEGTAMVNDAVDAAYFRQGMAAAMAAGGLRFLRIDLDDKPIAMLVNFVMGGGSFSFKIAIDEELGRFSPGVLIEIDNLDLVQGSDDIDWMDSCAAPDHPMIDSLWAERRSIAQYRIALKGEGLRGLRRDIAMAGTGAADALIRRLKGRDTA